MKTALSIFLLVIIGFLFLIYLELPSKESTGKKIVLVNIPDSSVILYEGIIKKSNTENISGLSFISCRYKMENEKMSEINVITPMAIAMNMRVGDIIYFRKTDVSSNSPHGELRTTGVGIFYDLNVGNPKYIQRLER